MVWYLSSTDSIKTPAVSIFQSLSACKTRKAVEKLWFIQTLPMTTTDE